ncbi:hypothetical protein WKY82_18695 [Gordonia malaquae]|uniref:hypothetical protein n=1 Tax=Gordonia malaquae TaxID=410332 RepID=UPI0030C795A2
MTNLGGAQHTWNSTQTSRLRDELMVGYERILATLPGLDGPGVGQIEVMVTAAQSALRESPPTWLSDAAAGTLGRGLATPAAATDLTAAGGSGFLLFESPVTMTTLGYAGPAGVAPLDAMLWWSASFDGHDRRPRPVDICHQRCPVACERLGRLDAHRYRNVPATASRRGVTSSSGRRRSRPGDRDAPWTRCRSS